MADVGDEFTAGGFRGLDAGDLVQHGERAAGGHGGGVDLEDAPLGKRTGAAGARLALFQSRAHTGQQFRVAHRVNQRAAHMNLRAGDALHLRVGPADQPFGSKGDHCLLHGVEQACQFLAAALDLGKALAQPLGGLIERGLHGGERIIAVLG